MSDWKPASEAPYDTICLFLTVDGNVVQGFIYDGDEVDFGYTHYMPLPELPPDFDQIASDPKYAKHKRKIESEVFI